MKRQAAAGPQDEREQFRQLTRELHEAAQAARDAARELRAEQASAAALAADQALTMINPLIAELNTTLKQAENNLIKKIEEANDLISERHAELLGFADHNELVTWLADSIMKFMKTPEFTGAVAEKLLSNAAHTYQDQREKARRDLGIQLGRFLQNGQFPKFEQS